MRKRLNVKLIIIIIIICIISIIGLVIFTKTDFFRTKRSAFFRYFNSTTDALEILTTDEFDTYKSKKENSPYIRNADVTIQSSSNIADSNILDKIKLSLTEKTDNKKEMSNMEFSLKKDSKNIIDISTIRNKSIYGVFCDEISSAYIGVRNEELKRIAKNAGINDIMLIPNEINKINISKILETSKIEKKHIAECLKIIKNDVPNNAYSKNGKKKIKINDKSYTTTSYMLNLDEMNSGNLKVDILSKISKDSILMDFAASKFKLLNFNEEYTTVNSLNEVIKDKITELQSNIQASGKLTITVYEFKQKNIRTEIKNGDTVIQIDHLKEDNMETSSIKINNITYMVQYNGTNYSVTYQNNSENGSKIKVDYNQDGTVENNDIKNNLIITVNQGIKSITYSYKDKVEFIDNIDNINDFKDETLAILNDYSDDEVKEFIKALKEKINSIYVSKGADIGINLDPLFEI